AAGQGGGAGRGGGPGGREQGGGEGEGARKNERTGGRGGARGGEPRRYGSHHGQGDRTMSVQRTLAIVKPDAVAKRVTGKIVARIEDAGFTILAAKLAHLSLAQARGFYVVHRQRPFYDSLCAFMTQGPSFLLALEGDNAIHRWRDLMVATAQPK